MQAVILAGGIGKRMWPLTLERPKPIIEVAGRTILERIIEALPDEIDEVILVIGYKGDMVRQYFGDSWGGRSITYVYQWMPAGTAHALSIAKPFLDGRFLLLCADDLHGTQALEKAISYPLSIVVATHTNPSQFGVVEVRPDGTLASIIEKPENPSSNLISTGAMVLDTRLFQYEAERHESGEYYMTSPLALFAKDHPFMVVEQDFWIPIGCPEDIEKTEAILLRYETSVIPTVVGV